MSDMTSFERFKAEATDCLENAASVFKWLDKPGDLFQCKPDALKKGTFYLMGFNPGGKPAGQCTLRRTLERTLIVHGGQAHPLRPGGKGKGWKRGWRNLDTLATALNIENWQSDLFITNLFPDISPRETCWDENHKGNLATFSAAIWPIHMLMLGIVQPDTIICHGKRAFYSVTRCLGLEECPLASAKFGRYVLRSARPSRADTSSSWESKVFVVGLPHLSRYSPSNSERAIALQAILGTRSKLGARLGDPHPLI
ncbi:MAG: hypothetical protein ABI351_13025 [Herbaspirillum sp.]